MHSARQSLGRCLAAGLIATHLLIVTMAMCPALHHWLHGDEADDPDHNCAVTMLVDGQFDRPDVVSLDPVQPIHLVELRAPARPALLLSAFSLPTPGGRAPPAI